MAKTNGIVRPVQVENKCPQAMRLRAHCLKCIPNTIPRTSVQVEAQFELCYSFIDEIFCCLKNYKIEVSKNSSKLLLTKAWPPHFNTRLFPNARIFKEDIKQCCSDCNSKTDQEEFFLSNFCLKNDSSEPTVIFKSLFSLEAVEVSLRKAVFLNLIVTLCKLILKLAYLERAQCRYYSAMAYCSLLFDLLQGMIIDPQNAMYTEATIHCFSYLNSKVFFDCMLQVSAHQHAECSRCSESFLLTNENFKSLCEVIVSIDNSFSSLVSSHESAHGLPMLEHEFSRIDCGTDFASSLQLQRGMIFFYLWNKENVTEKDAQENCKNSLIALEAAEEFNMQALCYYQLALRSNSISYCEKLNYFLEALKCFSKDQRSYPPVFSESIQAFCGDLSVAGVVHLCQNLVLSPEAPESGLVQLFEILPKEQISIEDRIQVETVRLVAPIFKAIFSLKSTPANQAINRIRWKNSFSFLSRSTVAVKAVKMFMNSIYASRDKKDMTGHCASSEALLQGLSMLTVENKEPMDNDEYLKRIEKFSQEEGEIKMNENRTSHPTCGENSILPECEIDLSTSGEVSDLEGENRKLVAVQEGELKDSLKNRDSIEDTSVQMSGKSSEEISAKQSKYLDYALKEFEEVTGVNIKELLAYKPPKTEEALGGSLLQTESCLDVNTEEHVDTSDAQCLGAEPLQNENLDDKKFVFNLPKETEIFLRSSTDKEHVDTALTKSYQEICTNSGEVLSATGNVADDACADMLKKTALGDVPSDHLNDNCSRSEEEKEVSPTLQITKIVFDEKLGELSSKLWITNSVSDKSLVTAEGHMRGDLVSKQAITEDHMLTENLTNLTVKIDYNFHKAGQLMTDSSALNLLEKNAENESVASEEILLLEKSHPDETVYSLRHCRDDADDDSTMKACSLDIETFDDFNEEEVKNEHEVNDLLRKEAALAFIDRRDKGRYYPTNEDLSRLVRSTLKVESEFNSTTKKKNKRARSRSNVKVSKMKAAHNFAMNFVNKNVFTDDKFTEFISQVSNMLDIQLK